VFAGLESDGTVITAETPGFTIAAFSYRPLEAARRRPIMEQSHPVADALPSMSGPATLPSGALRQYRWAGWNTPRYSLRLKDSYAILQKALQPLTAPPGTPEPPAQRAAAGR
jgi:hypothetical protein